MNNIFILARDKGNWPGNPRAGGRFQQSQTVSRQLFCPRRGETNKLSPSSVQLPIVHFHNPLKNSYEILEDYQLFNK